MAVQAETVRSKSINADRIATLGIAIVIFGVQGAWVSLLVWAGLLLVKLAAGGLS